MFSKVFCCYRLYLNRHHVYNLYMFIFMDVPKNHVFYNAILWGAQKKITTGYKSKRTEI